MNSLEDVPFQAQRSPTQQKVLLEVHVPDCVKTLQETQYSFDLEKLVLTGQPRVGAAPSCPPYWLMFSSAPGVSRLKVESRPRSHSLNSSDARRIFSRGVNFLLNESEDEDGYHEDDEGSESEDTVSKPPESRWCQTDKPLPAGQNPKKRQRSLGSSGRTYSQNSPVTHHHQRPWSAGPAVRNHREKKAPRTKGHGGRTDLDLLQALGRDERNLLESITGRGYDLRTAVAALQRTRHTTPEEILQYLEARERLCASGYEKVQVEEALEMFQNCEDKAGEFLRLLTQFNEMGFQQNSIKEVLLLHENHREKALEELMTRLN